MAARVRVTGSNGYFPVRIEAAAGEAVTFYVTGLQSQVDEPLLAEGPQLPESLGGISVVIRDHRESKDRQAPILSIHSYSSCIGLDKLNAASVTYRIAAAESAEFLFSLVCNNLRALSSCDAALQRVEPLHRATGSAPRRHDPQSGRRSHAVR